MRASIFFVSLLAGQITTAVSAENLNPERRGIGVEGIQGENVKESEVGFSPPIIKSERSLFVTHEKTLSVFSLTEVMDKLASEGEPGLTGRELFRRWWDTNNPMASAAFSDQKDHCDDEGTAKNGFSTLNGFPYACPRSEGSEARNGEPSDYIPIAAVNRLDLAGGDSCGEYRLVFARKKDVTTFNRNLLIFEMEVPNPAPGPGTGSLGCKPIAEFWADLSSDNDAVSRSAKLKAFYFSGVQGFAAPVSVKRLGGDPARPLGQIRSNQFMRGNPQEWLLREYRFNRSDGKLRIVRQRVAGNPEPSLFATKSGDPKQKDAEALAAAIVGGLPSLAAPREIFNIATPTDLNAGESNESTPIGDVKANFRLDGVIGTALTSALPVNSTLGMTPEQAVNRIAALTCSGCHHFVQSSSSIGQGTAVKEENWPPKGLSFVHVSEANRADCEGETKGCFGISNTLEELFIPHRKGLLEQMLAKTLR